MLFSNVKMENCQMDNFEVIHGGKLPIKAWTKGVQIEDAAKQQLINLSNMSFIHKHVAVMPDVHYGKGATVGSVIATKGAIIPASVGVDIGCGMTARRTTLKSSDLPDNLFALRTRIETNIPHGRTDNGGVNDRGAWNTIPSKNQEVFGTMMNSLKYITDKHPALERASIRAPNHMGTLGSGNHFVEICIDEEDYVWIMLHSGSRGIGNAIGQYFIERAKEEMRRWFINLPDTDLSYIPERSILFNDYFEALTWAQAYAALNRKVMMKAAINALIMAVPKSFDFDLEAVNCHHNYVSWERHFGENVMITRKGAVNAQTGVLGIIPGSMGAKSFIVRGKGNRDSFTSCSHGAGRVMSRTEARKKFTLEDHAFATKGIECRKDKDVIDETPKAYKDIDAVMKAQEDLVEIVHTLKQVVCVKG